MQQRVQLTSYYELNMPLTRQFRYAVANTRWRCSASVAQVWPETVQETMLIM